LLPLSELFVRQFFEGFPDSLTRFRKGGEPNGTDLRRFPGILSTPLFRERKTPIGAYPNLLEWEEGMTAIHMVMWYIDREKIASERQLGGCAALSVDSLSQGVRWDLGYYNCSRIHSANVYGCAFVEGKLSEILLDLLKYKPYLKFKFHPANDLDQVAVVFEKFKESFQLPDMGTVLDAVIEDLQKEMREKHDLGVDTPSVF
jgi:hypothetical protein